MNILCNLKQTGKNSIHSPCRPDNYPAFLKGRDRYNSGPGFSLSTNWHLLFKVHECTGEISRGRFEANSLSKFPWNVVKMKEEKAAFLSVVELTLWLCCLCEKSTIILVEIFSDMCCLEDNTSCKCQINTVARSI